MFHSHPKIKAEVDYELPSQIVNHIPLKILHFDKETTFQFWLSKEVPFFRDPLRLPNPTKDTDSSSPPRLAYRKIYQLQHYEAINHENERGL